MGGRHFSVLQLVGRTLNNVCKHRDDDRPFIPDDPLHLHIDLAPLGLIELRATVLSINDSREQRRPIPSLCSGQAQG